MRKKEVKKETKKELKKNAQKGAKKERKGESGKEVKEKSEQESGKKAGKNPKKDYRKEMGKELSDEAEKSYRNEEEFLEHYKKEDYEKLSVAVDLLVFTIQDNELKIVIIRRTEYPFKSYLALPGVFVGVKESVDEAARRGIKEEAGLEDIYFEQLYTFGKIDRDPRMRVISIAYFALVPIEKIHLAKGLRSDGTELMSVKELLVSDEKMAFDHKEILALGRERIRAKAEYTDLPFHFLPEEFTLPQLQNIYEILLGKKLYKANFRKKIADKIVETERMTSGDAHRPSRYYRQNKKN